MPNPTATTEKVKPEIKLDHILNELYATQKSYYDQLEFFVKEMKEYSKKINKKDQEALIAIINHYEKILQNKIFANNPYEYKVGADGQPKSAAKARAEAFKEIERVVNSEKLDMAYQAMSAVVNNFDGLLKQFAKLRDSEAINEYLMSKGKKLDAASYLVMPIQRGPRFVLFFEDLQKNFGMIPDNQKSEISLDMEGATKKVKAATVQINEGKRLHENVEHFNKLIGTLTKDLEHWKKKHLLRSHKQINEAIKQLQAIKAPSSSDEKELLRAFAEITENLRPILSSSSISDNTKKLFIDQLKNNDLFKDIQQIKKDKIKAGTINEAKPIVETAKTPDPYAKPAPLKMPSSMPTRQQASVPFPQKPKRPSPSPSGTPSAMFSSNGKNDYTTLFKGLTALMELMRIEYDIGAFKGDMKVLQDSIMYIHFNPNLKPEQKWDMLRDTMKDVAAKHEKTPMNPNPEPMDPMTKVMQAVISAGSTQASKDNLLKCLEKFKDITKDKINPPPRSTRG